MTQRGQLVVGTAGHIDHGKSRVVWSLTGVNPDRLPEEQARGMTIDLGFAHATIDDCDVWFVDVPGHERFLRNMVAGATGIDLPMLIVAADDSLMPQTREHAELLALLGFDRCLVVLTKMDLVDVEWAAAVEDEVRTFLQSLGITPALCVRTSAETGQGFDELRGVLAAEARRRVSSGGDQAAPGWFRMPIDRAFNVPGRGVVVTGSVYHGSVQAETELELWPAGRRVRVRGLQSHSEGREAAAGRMRLAINLAGVSLEDVQRGFELASPGYLEATRCADVHLDWLRMPGKTVRQRIAMRLHLATGERLVSVRSAAPPESDVLRDVLAQLRTAEPFVATWGQRFILRDETGSRTLGGGRMLRPVARPWSAKRPPREDAARLLIAGKPKQRIEEVIRGSEWRMCGLAALAARAGLRDEAAATEQCRQLGVEGRIVGLRGGDAAADGRAYVHADLLNAARERLVARLEKHLADNPRLPGLMRGEWLSWMPRACPERLRSALADWMIERGFVVAVGPHVVPKGHRSALSAEDRALLEAIVAEIDAGGFQPPGLKSLHCAERKDPRRVRELVELAVASAALVRIADGIWISQKHWRALVTTLVQTFEKQPELTVAAIRDLLASSRTFVVPIVEHTDTIGLTRRVGDVRKLGPKAASILQWVKANE
ncbi:MAG: selenocysteine-specific translation elongation factor [Planctomycetes bacterium]|nr:selenocysteine-specific translation elongation factor [Planctomycetota bacterium]